MDQPSFHPREVVVDEATVGHECCGRATCEHREPEAEHRLIGLSCVANCGVDLPEEFDHGRGGGFGVRLPVVRHVAIVTEGYFSLRSTSLLRGGACEERRPACQ